MNVLKKSGAVVPWDFGKVIAAVTKSATRINVKLTENQFAKLEAEVVANLPNETPLRVESIHGAVEAALRGHAPKVADSYANYRNYRKDVAEMWESIYRKTRETLFVGDRENANFNSALISTKGSLVRGYLTKELYKLFHLTKTEISTIEDGYLYIHDLRDLIFGGFNCCLFDMGAVLKDGFEMSGVHYKEPKSLLSALQVIGDVTLVATAQQYGGFTIAELDKVLVPYAMKSQERHRKNAVRFGVADPEGYVAECVHDELMQGLQSLEMKLNTVPCSRGDTAFVTVSFGNCDDPETAPLQRAICSAILLTRMHGQGNGSPVVFPKLVYLHSEAQHQDQNQQRLFSLAIKCSSQAMYPDYLSLDNSAVGEIFARTGKTVSPMGCRAFLSDYQDESGESYFVGRANIGAVSLNLPMIWHRSENLGCFFSELDHYLQMAREFLQRRYLAVAENPCSTNPLAFTQGGIRGGTKLPDEKVGLDIVKSVTSSFGITALNVLNVLYEGKPLHQSDRKFVRRVVDHIAARVEQFRREDGWLYALYATPAESLAGTQLQQFRDKFGEIPGVSDREYFTNGFHCPVTAEITPIEKQDAEHELFHAINGGHIQYVRLDNPSNLDAIKAIVKRGMKMGFYQGVNFDLVVCESCGYRPSKFTETCPQCGSHDVTTTSRVCGYLGVRHSRGNTRFNSAKVAEVQDRVSM